MDGVKRNLYNYIHPREFLKIQDCLEQKQKISLIVIKVKLNNVSVKVIIDTGSETSLISENIVNKLNLNNNVTKVPKINLIGINKKKFSEVNKSIIINLSVEDKNIEVQLLVVKDMEYDILLGTDELQKNNADINYETKTVNLNGVEIEFEENMRLDEATASITLRKENIKEEMLARKMYGIFNENKMVCEKEERIEENEDDLNGYYEDGNEANNILNVENWKEMKLDCGKGKKEKMMELLEKYEELFNRKSRVAKNFVHSLKVKNMETFRGKSYPIPYKYKDEMQEATRKLMEDKIIEYSTTPYINPIVIVKKKDGDIRICLDARELNKRCIPEYEAPLTIEAILGRISHAKIFTKLDLRHSFWLIPLDKDSRDYTGFMIDGVVYRFRVVPFGTQSATSALLKALHKVLNKFEQYTLHYIDDILIFSENEEEHWKHIEIILHALDEAGLKLNINKCEFFKKEVIYLGYKIDTDGVSMDANRIKIIKDYKRPTNLKTLRGFLGILHYFKRMVPDLTKKEIPLIELLRKNTKWKWTEEREKAFQEIKEEFTERAKIYHPDYTKTFILRTDASQQRFAGVLLQNQEIGEVPISFVSRITKKAEKNYSVSELELASILFCINKLRFFLLGNAFLIETDNQALTTILKNKYGNQRIHRWALLLQEYTFEIKYVPGVKNTIADAITRMDEEKVKEKRNKIIGINILKASTGTFSLERIKADQKKLTPREKEKTMTKEGIVYKPNNGKELYVISEELIREITPKLHNIYNHVGIRKLFDIFRENYIGRKDLSIIKDIISRCEVCQLGKDRNFHNENLPKALITERPLQMISVDFISNLVPSRQNNQHIFVITDVFSKYVKMYPCHKTNKKIVKKCLTEYFLEMGIPQTCVMDNATYFNNENLKAWLGRSNVEANYISIRHPCANLTERYIREIVKCLRILVHEQHELWEENLPRVEFYMNNVPHEVTKRSPITIMKDVLPERPWVPENNEDYEAIIKETHERIKRNAEKSINKRKKKIRKRVTFNKGELVIIRAVRVHSRKNNMCTKLQLPFEGPYIVQTCNGINSYELVHPITGKIRGIFNVDQLYRFVPEVGENSTPQSEM
ncbi:reverse transcriptase domain-containing protein [Wolbachia endosymbiont of Psylliodes chrysocephala]|uniref:reverse transcriptase domain-containing protein n=1 Tax=Wolbachia endosymbiont of Psylliodes chrysocephala TaxID=2883236 RepID=UPI0021117D43|nr:reverse transcriptase domain-containing protein [Wolbachia endosymbiont of Psylliodes chrysocephala]